MLFLLGPVVGFFGTGFFSGFTVIASEAFPTALRGTAMGLVYNIGRLLGAAAPWIIGFLAEARGITFALSSVSLAFLLAAIIASQLQESREHALA